jgi:hypothetical protein
VDYVGAKQILFTIHYEQQISEYFLTNPQLVGKGRKNSSPQVAKVGKYRERMESLEE